MNMNRKLDEMWGTEVLLFDGENLTLTSQINCNRSIKMEKM